MKHNVYFYMNDGSNSIYKTFAIFLFWFWFFILYFFVSLHLGNFAPFSGCKSSFNCGKYGLIFNTYSIEG